MFTDKECLKTLLIAPGAIQSSPVRSFLYGKI